MEGFGGAVILLGCVGKLTGNGCVALNPGWRLVELTLPWAKFYNPFRVEMVPSKHTCPLSPTRGGRGSCIFGFGIPWRIRAAMGRGVQPGHRDPI